MFRIGIIGCGKIAQVRHLPEYAANPDVQIAALTDLNEERTRELASRYGAKAYASAVELLADPSIDAVSICSANNSHAEMTIAALKAGKHVLCEKPMATTLEDCEAMARTARQAGKLLMIDQNQRLAPAHQKAREWINAGKIGRPLTFRTRFAHGGPETWSADPGSGTWFFDRKLAAMGVLADLGIHKTDLIQFLLGQKVTEVTAFLTTLDKRFSDGSLISLDDNALCLYKMSGGAVGTMTASWTHYGQEDNSTEIDGTAGTLRIYADPEHALVLNRKDGTSEIWDGGAIQTNADQTRSGIIDLFVECLKNPKVEGMSADSVLPAMRAVFAAIQSSKEGRTVRVNED